MHRSALALHVVLAVVSGFVWSPAAFAEGILDPLKKGAGIQKVDRTMAKNTVTAVDVPVRDLNISQSPVVTPVEAPLKEIHISKDTAAVTTDTLVQEVSASKKAAVAVVDPFKEMNIWHGGFNRTYLVHVPPSYNPAQPTSLVVAFHGGGGYSRLMATDKYYGWISKSDKEGFIVVFPNGTSPFEDGRFGTWNAGRCCAYARDHLIDDVGFVRDVVFDVEAAYNIDTKRVFATGMSNGGMMSYSLACRLPDMFRAVASVAGTDNTIDCRPQKSVSILHIHAKDDDHVLFNGGAGPTIFKDKSKVTEFTSVPLTISMWLKHNNCSETSKKVVEESGASCDLYSQCSDGAQVQLCVTEEGGHSWPGAKATPLQKPHNPSTAINATDVIWDFFQSQNEK
jgi:polyhydroxybutyrate depolymerase